MQVERIRVGVGGWTYEPWRGTFYSKGMPHSDELSYASRQLTSIEVDGTFYRGQSPETYRRWHDETPDDFIFSLKAPRYITNRSRLAEAGNAIRGFVDGVKNLGEKLGPINWRIAENKPFDPEDFEAFLALLPKGFRHAVEARHESFKCDRFVGLARKYGVAVVLAGDSEYPLMPDITAPFVYARIMGTIQEHESGYSESQLDAWAQRARTLASGEVPAEFQTVSAAAPRPGPRDLFLYVISGYKQSNPAAAMALIKRLR